jgi:hypothetical protein
MIQQAAACCFVCWAEKSAQQTRKQNKQENKIPLDALFAGLKNRPSKQENKIQS